MSLLYKTHKAAKIAAEYGNPLCPGTTSGSVMIGKAKVKSTAKVDTNTLSNLVEITGTVGDTINLNHTTDTPSTALLILILILWIRSCAFHLF